MSTKAELMEKVLKKHKHHVDEFMNMFDTTTLKLMKEASTILIKKLEVEKMIVDTTAVKDVIQADIMTTQHNLAVINSAIVLKGKKIANFCYN